MSNKAARNLFILGSLFFFAIFLGLTYDTMGKLDKRAPEITGQINAGKMVWHKYDCIGCHTIFGNGSYFAPELAKITENKPKDYLKKFLMDPKAVNPKAAMPTFGIAESGTSFCGSSKCSLSHSLSLLLPTWLRSGPDVPPMPFIMWQPEHPCDW